MPVNRSKYDVAVNLVCFLLLVGVAAYLMVNWSSIPDKIPAHYNAMGEIDRWGNKGELLILPIVGWIMYIGMTIVEHFPQIWNTGVTVTKENRERVYRILKNMLVTTKLIAVATFVFLTINSACAKALPAWFLPAFLAITFGTLVFFIIKLVMAK